jgi:CRISPR system Cascade subunit CasE
MRADWSGIGVEGWLAIVDPPINLCDGLKLDTLASGQAFRFRLRANPSVRRNGRRLGLLRLEEQLAWIERKGSQHGFSIPKSALGGHADSLGDIATVRISQERMLKGRQHDGNEIRVYSVLYDGFLLVAAVPEFREALRIGIGHGKAMGLGLLSVAPLA